MIDPACGSGHFLLGAFPRILDRWQRKEPGTNVRELVQRALNSIHGVDVNPYAVAIARFRLLLAAMRACNVHRLADAPAFRLNLACGDSLLHAPLSTGQQVLDFELTNGDLECEHAYQSEDLPVLKRMLRGGQYHAVVANPPYIVPRDKQLNERYRKRFKSCHRQYSLAVPFLERIFRLAVHGGYTGQITANSFMKREFGKKLIESFFPTVDLTHVIDTSGAYIPGHGTPTVILFGRHRPPMATTVRAVMGICGEPSTPDEPSKGRVWSAIVKQLDQARSQSDFVSVADTARNKFCKHPWSIGGGGASDLKTLLDANSGYPLESFVDSPIGRAVRIAEEEAFIFNMPRLRNSKCDPGEFRGYLVGENVRDWCSDVKEWVWYPYAPGARNSDMLRQLWAWRTTLANRSTFQGVMSDAGLDWFDYMQHTPSAYRTSLSIAFAFVASHNHFVLSRGGRVFKQSAPVIKLPNESTEEDHLVLLGYLNSSTACFSLKQISHQKQMVGGDGVRIESRAVVPYEFAGIQMLSLSIPETWNTGPLRERLLGLTRRIDRLATRHVELTPQSAIDSGVTEIRETWKQIQAERQRLRSQMVLLQEEIDFTVYAMWGLAKPELLSDKLDWEEVTLDAGDRPFTILRGRSEDDFAVPNGIPTAWPTDLRDLWQRRMEAINQSSELRLIEDPHYKRRWRGRQGLFNHNENKNELQTACISWMTDRLESCFDFDGRMNEKGQPTSKLEISLVSVANLADIARQDTNFLRVGELYKGDQAFDVQAIVAELVAAECVPLLPVLRYKPGGLIKRGTWERTWDLQRLEDAIDARTKLPSTDPDHLTEEVARDLKQEQIGNIPVPTKYDSKDFLTSNLWRLRGKLDVPKERWISFPHCEGPDGTPVIAWAGYDHLQQARAISAYYVRVQTEFGGSDDPRLVPLLACLLELLPWLKQWHNEPDPAFDGMRMGDYFEGFVNEEARQLNKTLPEIKAWTPPARTSGRGRRKSS